MDDFNPCLSCGACCHHFRVSFYWSEADPFLGGTVPVELTEKINNNYICMQGTNQPNPRCIALEGTLGECVSCRIYTQRPTPCREFPLWLDDGSLNPECNRLRALKGMPPIVLPDHQPNDDPPLIPSVA